MARESLDIVVTEKGAVKVKKNIEAIGTQSKVSASSVDFLKNALKTFAGAAALRELVNIADSYTNIQNRLKNVTRNTSELNVVTKQLFAISNRTRSSFEGTAEVYARTALALKDVGISQKDTLEFTESLNQAVILSGASAQEAQAGLIQLSQGLASGTLRGDELRAVLEQLPAVADVISKEMGITRGELRKLGTEGKITSKIILEAFKSAREELAEKFGKTVPTISQSFQVLKNNVTQYVGELDKANGATAILSKTILFAAENIDTLARVALAAGIALGIGLAQRGIGALILAVRTLGVAIKANPLGALLQAAIVVGSAIAAFSDKLKLSSDGLANLQDFFVVTFEAIKNVVGGVTSFLADKFGGAFSFIQDTFGKTELSLKGLIAFFAKGADFILGAYVGLFNAIKEGAGLLPSAITDISLRAFNGLLSLAESTVNKIIAVINPVLKFAGGSGLAEVAITRLENVAQGGAKNLGETVKNAFLEGFKTNVVANTVTGLFDKAEDRAKKRAADEARLKKEEADALKGLAVAGKDLTKPESASTKGPTFEKILADLRTQNQLLQLNTREREIASGVVQIEDQLKRKLTETEKGLIANLIEENRRLEEQSSILDEIRGPQQNFESKLDSINQLMAKGKITLDEYNQKLVSLKLESLQTSRTLEGGLQKGLLAVGQQFGDVSQVAQTTVVNAFGAAENALAKFAETGKFSVKDMVDSIFADLSRLAVRSAITGPLANAIGTGTAGGGGSLGFLSGLFGGNNAAAGGGGGVGGAAALGSLAASFPGFKNGAEFQVGGVGGTDSQFVGFRASPDETVKVTKPGQSSSNERPIQVTFNIQTPDADSFQRSQSQILAKTSASLSRANRRNN